MSPENKDNIPMPPNGSDTAKDPGAAYSSMPGANESKIAEYSPESLSIQPTTSTNQPAEELLSLSAAVDTPVQITEQIPPEHTLKTSTGLKSRFKLPSLNLKKAIMISVLVILFVTGVAGAYLFGKRDQKVILQQPPAQQLDLPPQAVVVAECVENRGKQYVLPKDIPGGPIYDVVNDKVVAIEYNLNVSELVTNPDDFSNTILRLAKDYPIDHLVLIPIVPKDGGQVENALLVTYVVSREEAKSITCNSGSE